MRVADEFGPELGYKPIDRSALSQAEIATAGHGLKFDATRAVLAAVFGLGRDDFARYLDGKLSLDQVMAIREARAEDAPPPPSVRRAGPPRYNDHPRWRALCAAAIELDPELKAETLAELGENFISGKSLETVDAALVAQVARALQGWNARRVRRP